MGCHTWFYKRTTINEMQVSEYVHDLKKYDDIDIDWEYKELSEIPDFQLFLQGQFERESTQRNLKTRDKQAKNHYLNHKYVYYERVKDFNDEFRIRYYPFKRIFNLRQLRRYLGKRYFKLDKEQIDRLKLFWVIYPNGMLDFG